MPILGLLLLVMPALAQNVSNFTSQIDILVWAFSICRAVIVDKDMETLCFLIRELCGTLHFWI